MRSGAIPVIFLTVFLAGYALVFPSFEVQRAPLKKLHARGLILPPPVMKLLSMEFRTVVADVLFARASQYFGGKIDTGEASSREDLRWFYSNLLVITDLDPYFEDPYYFGNALFTWDAGMYNEANTLLQKATQARSWDWQFPFFLGFNKFYFQEDRKGGADYVLIASRRPRAPVFLPTLAARLYTQVGMPEVAIDFLTVFWENERDLMIRQRYEMRIDALQRILFLEKAVRHYRIKTGSMPKTLNDLVDAGLMQSIPTDPYGGTFYLAKDGSVRTTSEFSFTGRRRGSNRPGNLK